MSPPSGYSAKKARTPPRSFSVSNPFDLRAYASVSRTVTLTKIDYTVITYMGATKVAFAPYALHSDAGGCMLMRTVKAKMAEQE